MQPRPARLFALLTLIWLLQPAAVADYEGQNLTGRDFSGQNLSGLRFNLANLTNANLTNTRLDGASLAGARLEGAIFTGAMLTGANLGGALYSAHTIWPSGFDPVAAGALRAEVNLARGLILHYPFNGSAEDASGGGRHGTLGGSAGNAAFGASDRRPADPAKGSFTVTGNLVHSRHSFTAAPLPSGEVLAAGGLLRDETPLSSAEIYSAGTGTWRLTGPLAAPRAYPVSAVLPDGRVLIAGGLTQLNPSLPSATAEWYDPRTGTWSAAGSLALGRVGLTLTALRDGRVLATGGWYRTATGATVVANTAELFDPRTGAWSAAGVMTSPRVSHTATLLPDGRVLVAGGGAGLKPAGGFYSVGSAEIYDPGAGTWTATGSLLEPREQHWALRLANGQVLLSGGGQDNSMRFLATAELYDPATGVWRAAAPMSRPRQLSAAALLPDGHVLVSGGDADFATHATAEIYEPARDRWVPTGAMSGVRHSHRAVSLRDGRVVTIGGYDSNRSPPQ